MPYCLIPSLADIMKKMMKAGKINPETLTKMSSAEREAFFEKVLGLADARNVNALFESKLLLKNRQRGMITWAKTITGIKEPVRRDIITKIEKLDKVLDAKSERLFLEDLASKRLGVDIDFNEAKIITELSRDFGKAKELVAKGADPVNVNYGAKKVALQNYVKLLKIKAQALPFREAIKNPLKIFEFIAGNLKSVKASLDNSAVFRQGWKAMFTHPQQWADNAIQSFKYIGRTLRGDKNVLDVIKADIYGRKNSINSYYEKAKLAIGTGEEAYPESAASKIPVFGKLFTASEVAYEGFLMKLRADIFDKLVIIQEKGQGAKLSDLDLRSLGSLVNSLTGRGGLGPLEKIGRHVNVVFFSPKNLQANIDTLTLHAREPMSAFARKQAALNLVKIIGGITTILGIARAVGAGVELDPRSSDFGKIRVKDTRFDVTAGMGSLVVLVSRIIRQSSKSSTSGIVSKFNEGYGSQSADDVLLSFMENKLSPAASLIKDLITQEDFIGNKPTIKGELGNVTVPMLLSTGYELLSNPNSANPLLSIIADGLGISTNTYSYQSNWEQSTGKELTQLKEKIGEQKFKEATDKYNQLVNDYILKTKNDKEFLAKSEEEKQAQLTKEKGKIKDKIFREYNFKYKKK